jgi:CDP-diglyceride synthetase
MQGLFFETDTGARNFIRALVVLIGFWTAWRAGKAAADGWSTYPLVIVYVLLLGLVMRFLHHALFDGPMLSPFYYVIDVVLLLIVATAGYRYRRTNQMVNNYYWLYERTSVSSWKKKN